MAKRIDNLQMMLMSAQMHVARHHVQDEEEIFLVFFGENQKTTGIIQKLINKSLVNSVQ